MESRVIRLNVELAVFVRYAMTVGDPVEIDAAALDKSIQEAVKRTVPGAHATGDCKITAKVDGRFDVRRMAKLERGR